MRLYQTVILLCVSGAQLAPSAFASAQSAVTIALRGKFIMTQASWMFYHISVLVAKYLPSAAQEQSILDSQNEKSCVCSYHVLPFRASLMCYMSRALQTRPCQYPKPWPCQPPPWQSTCQCNRLQMICLYLTVSEYSHKHQIHLQQQNQPLLLLSSIPSMLWKCCFRRSFLHRHTCRVRCHWQGRQLLPQLLMLYQQANSSLSNRTHHLLTLISSSRSWYHQPVS